MQFKRSIIAASLLSALALTGCGSDDSSSSTGGNNGGGTTTPTAKVIKVIDGYLSEAQVCVDRNKNDLCESNEVVGMTNAKGEITIKKEDAGHAVIAKAIAGKTSDSDKAGKLGSSYELVANADSKVVTPFTTMAEVQNTTVEALAAKLNLDANVISGDYVAAKGTAADKAEAQKAHLLARSLTNELAPTLAGNNPETLATSAEKITKVIDETINNQGTDKLDDIVIDIDENGQTSTAPVIASLNQYLEGNTLHFASMNKSYAAEEGVFQVHLDKGTLTVTNDLGESITGTYSIKDNTLIHEEEGEKSQEEFVYISAQTSLAVTPQGDLSIWTTENLNASDYTPKKFTTALLTGQTWYFLSDDSINEHADPMLAGMTFGTDDNVTITEGDEILTAKWHIQENENGDYNTLLIDFPEGENDMNIKLLTKDSNIMTIADQANSTGKDHFSLLLKDKALAESILAKWGTEL
ncbi:hypothetical protein ABT56_04600 [Photobacterium aquae]|uniref:Lipoprotein n=1 Tax=Photobacterium aquae TaxID=1195763 RepID=A0A0J1H6L3_9GAMM|nr:hypothetical protein [Photobacterium aquae]KLV07349.1 hypothetical protein ABT56_04600 [Photobacterium aquae]